MSRRDIAKKSAAPLALQTATGLGLHKCLEILASPLRHARAWKDAFKLAESVESTYKIADDGEIRCLKRRTSNDPKKSLKQLDTVYREAEELHRKLPRHAAAQMALEEVNLAIQTELPSSAKSQVIGMVLNIWPQKLTDGAADRFDAFVRIMELLPADSDREPDHIPATAVGAAIDEMIRTEKQYPPTPGRFGELCQKHRRLLIVAHKRPLLTLANVTWAIDQVLIDREITKAEAEGREWSPGAD